MVKRKKKKKVTYKTPQAFYFCQFWIFLNKVTESNTLYLFSNYNCDKEYKHDQKDKKKKIGY